MKYKAGDNLLYVCPFVFVIERVHIDFAYKEDDRLYYIESTGAYLKEEDLFDNLEDAKQNAFEKLNDFYVKKFQEIHYSKGDNVPKQI